MQYKQPLTQLFNIAYPRHQTRQWVTDVMTQSS